MQNLQKQKGIESEPLKEGIILDQLNRKKCTIEIVSYRLLITNRKLDNGSTKFKSSIVMKGIQILVEYSAHDQLDNSIRCFSTSIAAE